MLWLNSAETWVDVYSDSQQIANFVSESGQIDVVMFMALTPKELLTKLAELTGFAPLPPIYSLGFHFSKYE
jgi:alpha-glucosidase (family GH31 glycosyl hydrolase)